jgi:hypothetical protein
MDHNRKYSSRISGATALIPETKTILLELAKGIDLKEVEKRVYVDNILDKVTLRSREKAYSAIKLRYLLNPIVNRTILINIVSSNLDSPFKDLVLYYYLSKAEKVVYDLTVKFLYEKFEDGNLEVSKEETLAFFELQMKKHPEIKNWTPTTRLRTVEHYLAIMKDFKFLKGSKKKKFNIPFIPLEIILFVVYNLLQDGLNAKQTIASEDFKLFFLDKEDVIRYLDDASRKGLIRFKHTGKVYEISPHFKNLEGYIDEITREI